MTLGQAQGVYVRTLLDSLGGNYSSMRDCLIINGRMYQEIAKINAEAVCGVVDFNLKLASGLMVETLWTVVLPVAMWL